MNLKIVAKNKHLEIVNNLTQANIWFESKEQGFKFDTLIISLIF